MQLQTLWVKKGRDAGIDELDKIEKVNKMLSKGWELVSWQPFGVPGMSNGITVHPKMYDVYLLKHD